MAEYRDSESAPIVVPEHLTRRTTVEDWCTFDVVVRTAVRDGYDDPEQFVYHAELCAFLDHLYAFRKWIDDEGLTHHESRDLSCGADHHVVWRDKAAFIAQAEEWLRDMKPTLTTAMKVALFRSWRSEGLGR